MPVSTLLSRRGFVLLGLICLVASACSNGASDGPRRQPNRGRIESWDPDARRITLVFDGQAEESAYLFTTEDDRQGRYWLYPENPPHAASFGEISPDEPPYEKGQRIRGPLTLALPPVDLSEAEVCLHLDRTECVFLGEKFSA